MSALIKYLGSKRRLVPEIVGAIREFSGAHRILDLFSGTSRVGHALKRQGFDVVANDHLRYAHVLARCYVQADGHRVAAEASRCIAEMERLAPAPGWFTETYCVRSRYLHPENGARVEAMRRWIAARGFEPDLEAVLLTALLEAADRVDSTTGLQMAYLKHWAPRALRPLALRLPDLLPGTGTAINLDALEAASTIESDVAYLDPPYNQHRYLGNYHVWESLVRFDEPEVYGVACKRIDCRSYVSPFNSRRAIVSALATVIERVRARHLVVSFSDEGFVAREVIEAMLATRGCVEVRSFDARRYVGAQIGVYNPQGERVGEPGRLRNVEHLFVVTARARPSSRAA